MKTGSSIHLFTAFLAVLSVSGCSSPYPLSYTVRWPYYYIFPSVKNHTDISPKPLKHDFNKNISEPSIKLMFCGDIMVRDRDETLEFDPKLKELLKKADIVIANCEAPVSDEITPCEHKKYYFKFLMPAEYLQETISQGKSKWIVSIANNHIADEGEDGFNKTISSINSISASIGDNLAVIGPKNIKEKASYPLNIFEVGNLRVGIVAWTQWLNKEGLLDANQGVYRHEDIFSKNGKSKTDWHKVKKQQNLHTIIAYPHWEYEFQHFPSKETLNYARELICSGIDIIVGSHPHTLQAMEWYKGKLCLFSLGNFCGLTGGWPTKLTAVLEIQISSSSDSYGEILSYTLHPVIQSDETNQLILLNDYQGDLKKRYIQRLGKMYMYTEDER